MVTVRDEFGSAALRGWNTCVHEVTVELRLAPLWCERGVDDRSALGIGLGCRFLARSFHRRSE